MVESVPPFIVGYMQNTPVEPTRLSNDETENEQRTHSRAWGEQRESWEATLTTVLISGS